ncbi:MAG: NUDIX hydrolase, partial [Motilibacteraceae bacterium]
MAGGTSGDDSSTDGSSGDGTAAGEQPEHPRPEQSRVPRRAARVLLLDPDDRLLLFRGGDPDRPDQTFWFTPGGGMEPGETSEQTVRRELAEELGLTQVAVGRHVWDRRAQFTFRGVDYDQHEVYHLARCAPFAVDVSGMSELERSAHVEHRWWTLDDLLAAQAGGTDVFAPPDLAPRLAELLHDGAPAAPVRVLGSVLP